MIAPAPEDLPLPDGQVLATSWFTPPAGEPHAAVLIVPAMGVAQEFYAPLASWLAGHGYLVATFDYRGVGRSRRTPLRRVDADILDWARVDCAAMVDAVTARAPSRPLYWVGHSLGGQILPFVPNHERVKKMVTVATGSGYWRENSASLRRTVWWLWFVAVPVSVRLFGYFPGRALRKVGDLPRGVIEQWRRWCLHREYSVGVEGDAARELYAGVSFPVVSLSFTDDEYMSERNIESIHSFYAGAPRTMKRLSPEDLGVRRVGHFGFFRPWAEAPLWRAHLLPELGSA